MPRQLAFHVIRDTLAAEPRRDFTVQALQYETGYGRTTVQNALRGLEFLGRVTVSQPASGPLYTYRAPCASSARVRYDAAGRCNGCNGHSDDGTVREIRAGQTRVRLCDQCLADAGLAVRE